MPEYVWIIMQSNLHCNHVNELSAVQSSLFVIILARDSEPNAKWPMLWLAYWPGCWACALPRQLLFYVNSIRRRLLSPCSRSSNITFFQKLCPSMGLLRFASKYFCTKTFLRSATCWSFVCQKHDNNAKAQKQQQPATAATFSDTTASTLEKKLRAHATTLRSIWTKLQLIKIFYDTCNLYIF